MINLKHEVQSRGYTVAHIKTDSIKIPNADEKIISFVKTYGEMYGYAFEHEATYEKMCLVNDAVYIAKYAKKKACEKLYNYIPDENQEKAGKWTATGTQFQVPYVFKTLFSKEKIIFDDLCETKSVTTALYLGHNNDTDDENYIFIGKVGSFCPMLPCKDAGTLVREGEDKEGNVKYSAVVGTKGYLWCESETVKELGIEDKIDMSYYNKLVDDAVDTIKKYDTEGNFLES